VTAGSRLGDGVEHRNRDCKRAVQLPIMEVHLMTDMMSGVENAEDSKPATGLDGLDEQLVAQLLSSAKASGLKLTGEGGVLQQPTKRLLKSAFEARSPITSAMTSTTRLAAGSATHATAPAPRPCSAAAGTPRPSNCQLRQRVPSWRRRRAGSTPHV
jgi:hypothetical protein